MKVELSGGSVRINSSIAVVAADTGNVRLAITAPHGELVLPVYGARHYAEQILRACREAEVSAVEDSADPRVPRRPAA
ncbi:hypothetical protein [Methylobacterium brachythecii]|uniref:Uncharacterized protein n=1 Tax=Methylobacterium brachythecii TaxID=1176177 RepID=A0A7W6AIZ4_9HYPH|nr:hypothetical protein [Methylobacterium brachythecii]MBB3904223.1 hypothetical protein [Methylobacterium brachythecii]GLS45114.1 hypothetical protein GCM10007884_31030 [Methylobacterium brachythecii]